MLLLLQRARRKEVLEGTLVKLDAIVVTSMKYGFHQTELQWETLKTSLPYTKIKLSNFYVNLYYQ
jgi:hypothetical protein